MSEFALRVARWIAGLANAKDGDFAVALSGGTTPRPVYEALAEEKLPWERIHWFWGDERFVPPDDALSNYRMAREAMLSRAPRPNVHPIPTVGLTPVEAAEFYERELRAFRAAGPLFDLTLLGLGSDGHTASLFPGSPVLAERVRLVCAVEDRDPPRVTLTYRALEDSAHVAFLVTGAEKRRVLERVRLGDMSLPASRVRPKGELRFFTDND